MAKLTLLGEPAFATPGDDGYTVADLEPGGYVREAPRARRAPGS